MSNLKSIESRYPLDLDQVSRFREDGFVLLRRVFKPRHLRAFAEVLAAEVDRLNSLKGKRMEDRTTYEKAFVQVVNVWRRSDDVARFVFGRRLARIATELLGVSGVRLYHDQALFKEGGGGITPWHADQYYWPLSSEKTVTAWIPLQDTPLEMGPLSFSRGSHVFQDGRDLGISDESERMLDGELQRRGYEHVVEPFALGDVSFHCGWTYHRARPNTTDTVRRAFTIIYMEDGIRLAEPERAEHEADRKAFIPGRKPGQPANTEMNPLLYP